MQILGLFCHIIALILGQSSGKYLRVTKNVEKIRFEELWVMLELKTSFQRQ